MATVKIFRGGAARGYTEVVDLFGNSGGFKIAFGGWSPRVGRYLGNNAWENVIDTFTLRVEGTSHNNLASNLQTLDDAVRRALDDLSGGLALNLAWLRVQLDDESELRQSLIVNIGRDFNSGLLGPPTSPGNFVREYSVAIEHVGVWEAAFTKFAGSSTTAIDTLGGTLDFSTIGNAPGRIYALDIIGNTGGPLTEFWLGFRSDRLTTPPGDRTDFEPLWECEDGAAGTDTSSSADGTASGGSKMTCTFADETMQPRVTVELQDVVSAAQRESFQGAYQVLLRAKVTSSRIARVRLLSGYSSTNGWRIGGRVRVNSTDWLLYSLGKVQMPPFRTPEALGASYVDLFALRIEAESESGSGNLDMDALILIPQSEGAVYISGGSVQSGGGRIVFRQMPDGESQVQSLNSSLRVDDQPEFSEERLGIPNGDVRMTFVAQRASLHVLGDAASITLNYIPRWQTLRGSES